MSGNNEDQGPVGTNDGQNDNAAKGNEKNRFSRNF